jgi:hypothetical protein
MSHTFTHEAENNATYFDIFREITWNQAWLTQSGLASAAIFSPHGIVPPAITGLHNGDAIKAWMDNGITNVVGDNSRPLLRNTVSFANLRLDNSNIPAGKCHVAIHHQRCRQWISRIISQSKMANKHLLQRKSPHHSSKTKLTYSVRHTKLHNPRMDHLLQRLWRLPKPPHLRERRHNPLSIRSLPRRLHVPSSESTRL